MKKNVAVLTGGFSSEKEISLKSGEVIYQNINRSKYTPKPKINTKIKKPSLSKKLIIVSFKTWLNTPHPSSGGIGNKLNKY